MLLSRRDVRRRQVAASAASTCMLANAWLPLQPSMLVPLARRQWNPPGFSNCWVQLEMYEAGQSRVV